MIERAFERARLTIEWNERRVKRTYEGTIPILLGVAFDVVHRHDRALERSHGERKDSLLARVWIEWRKREGKVKEGKKRVCRVGVAKITRTDIMVV